MEKKFTPGPWAYYEPMKGHLSDRCNTIAVGSDLETRDHICFIRKDSVGGIDSDTAEANARLIAASPKLLWALGWAAAALQLACRPGRAIAEGSVIESQGATKTVAAILDEADSAIADAIGVQVQDADAVNPTGVMLEVGGYTCTWELFHRNNSGEDAMLSAFDLAKVEALKVGESLYLGIQEVKRIQ